MSSSRRGSDTGERLTSCATGSAGGRGRLLRGAKGEQLRPVLAEPVALLAPAGTAALDERPEAARVVRDAQVAELVHDDVVEHLEGREHEPPVEGERAAGGARAPQRALAADPDPRVLDAESLRLLLGQRGDELAGGDARLRLPHRAPLEPEPRHLR